MTVSEIISVLVLVVFLGFIGIKWFKKTPNKSTFDPNKVPVDLPNDGLGGSGGGDGTIIRHFK